MTAKRFEIFVIVTIIALLGIIYAFTQGPALAPSTTEQTAGTLNETLNQATTTEDSLAKQQVPVSVVTYPGVDGKNALELLQASHRVEVKHYSFGDMVESIDGLAADSTTNFWEFLVNDKQSPVGASTYITKSSDTITWRLSTINPQ